MALSSTKGAIGVAVGLLCTAYQAVRIGGADALRCQATLIDAHQGVAVYLRDHILTLCVVRLLLTEKVCVGNTSAKDVRGCRFLIAHDSIVEGTSHKVVRL